MAEQKYPYWVVKDHDGTHAGPHPIQDWVWYSRWEGKHQKFATVKEARKFKKDQCEHFPGAKVFKVTDPKPRQDLEFWKTQAKEFLEERDVARGDLEAAKIELKAMGEALEESIQAHAKSSIDLKKTLDATREELEEYKSCNTRLSQSLESNLLTHAEEVTNLKGELDTLKNRVKDLTGFGDYQGDKDLRENVEELWHHVLDAASKDWVNDIDERWGKMCAEFAAAMETLRTRDEAILELQSKVENLESNLGDLISGNNDFLVKTNARLDKLENDCRYINVEAIKKLMEPKYPVVQPTPYIPQGDPWYQPQRYKWYEPTILPMTWCSAQVKK